MSSGQARRQMDRLYLETLEAEFEQWPGVTWAFSLAGKHARCDLTFEGRSKPIFMPLTPSDARGHLNCRQDARGVLRELGAVRTEREKSEREDRGYRPPPPKRLTQIAKSITPPTEQVDPFDPLREIARGMTRDLLSKWDGKTIKPDKLDEAARLLLTSWHPDAIARAAELIQDSQEK